MNKLSIIIPCYKREEQVIRTINCLFDSAGWGKEFEAEIIVADCTENDSVKNAVKKKFRDKISYVCPQNPGVASNKNIGAKAAKYPLLLFIDSDMEVEKETIVSSINYLKEHPSVAALTTKVVWKGNDKEGQLDRPKDEDRLLSYKNTTFTEFIYSRFNMTYREVFEKVGGYDEKVFNMRGEGSDLSTRYWRAGFPLAYNMNTKVHHHEVDKGIGSTANHPEWGVAKDYLLLGYKYGNFNAENCDYFASTVKKNMENYSKNSQFSILKGIAQHYDLIANSKQILDRQIKKQNPKYPFAFMEVFSDEETLKKCINGAEERLKNIRNKTFNL